jgi:hypothetical protein
MLGDEAGESGSNGEDDWSYERRLDEDPVVGEAITRLE